MKAGRIVSGVRADVADGAAHRAVIEGARPLIRRPSLVRQRVVVLVGMGAIATHAAHTAVGPFLPTLGLMPAVGVVRFRDALARLRALARHPPSGCCSS